MSHNLVQRPDRPLLRTRSYSDRFPFLQAFDKQVDQLASGALQKVMPCRALGAVCQLDGSGRVWSSSQRPEGVVRWPQVAGLWGNAQGVLRAAAQSVTETVEEGVRDVSSLHAVKAASGCGLTACMHC